MQKYEAERRKRQAKLNPREEGFQWASSDDEDASDEELGLAPSTPGRFSAAQVPPSFAPCDFSVAVGESAAAVLTPCSCSGTK